MNGEKIFPGTNFGLKFKPARRTVSYPNSQVSPHYSFEENQPLLDCNYVLKDLPNDLIHNGQTMAEEQFPSFETNSTWNERQAYKTRFRNNRFEVEGLLHPDDIVGNRKKRKRNPKNKENVKNKSLRNKENDAYYLIKAKQRLLYGDDSVSPNQILNQDVYELPRFGQAARPGFAPTHMNQDFLACGPPMYPPYNPAMNQYSRSKILDHNFNVSSSSKEGSSSSSASCDSKDTSVSSEYRVLLDNIFREYMDNNNLQNRSPAMKHMERDEAKWVRETYPYPRYPITNCINRTQSYMMQGNDQNLRQRKLAEETSGSSAHNDSFTAFDLRDTRNGSPIFGDNSNKVPRSEFNVNVSPACDNLEENHIVGDRNGSHDFHNVYEERNINPYSKQGSPKEFAHHGDRGSHEFGFHGEQNGQDIGSHFGDQNIDDFGSDPGDQNSPGFVFNPRINPSCNEGYVYKKFQRLLVYNSSRARGDHCAPSGPSSPELFSTQDRKHRTNLEDDQRSESRDNYSRQDNSRKFLNEENFYSRESPAPNVELLHKEESFKVGSDLLHLSTTEGEFTIHPDQWRIVHKLHDILGQQKVIADHILPPKNTFGNLEDLFRTQTPKPEDLINLYENTIVH